MKKQVEIAKIFMLIVILLQVIPITGSIAIDTNPRRNFALDTTHEFVLDALSWEATPISCVAGDSLSGEFTLTNNGDLFIGDQTKYDNWLLDGIDFLILDAANYALWKDDISVTSLYQRESVFELEWSSEIPTEGTWYIIYYNDSIFMKTVEGKIQHFSQSGLIFPLLLVILIGLPSLLALIFMFKKKK